MNKASPPFSFIASFLLGVGSVFFAYRIGVVFGFLDSTLLLAFGAVMILLDSAIISALFLQYLKSSLLLLFLGIQCGVISDATYDFFVNKIDRNLLPIEMLIWTALVPLPMYVGQRIGRSIAKKRLNHL